MEVSRMITRLRANAEILAALVAGVSEEQARWRPEADKWSMLEVVCHLADEEVEDFRTRLDLTLHRPGVKWPPIDPQEQAVGRAYNTRDLEEELARFLAARGDSLAWLEGLADPDWSLAYEHPKAGPITAGDLLTSWVAHDHIHIRQLNRLHREYLVEKLSGHSPEYAGSW
jgi:hypothetical protein